MMILSADTTVRISKVMLRRFVRENFGLTMSEGAADELSRILEKKARDISEYAVGKAKKRKRSRILTEDIESYKIKFD